MRVDAHHHLWNLNECRYDWLTPEAGILYQTFEPEDLQPLITHAKIDRTVLVQSANSYEDTASMLRNAHANAWIGAVIGWVDLLNPQATAERLAIYSRHPKFRGIRHLIHAEADPDWVVQNVVIESLQILAEYQLIFEIPAVFPNHLRHIPMLAERLPNLTIVIDHLGKPPIQTGQIDTWADQLRAAAAFPNVYAKVSGLNTAASPNWDAAELRPYIDVAFACFSADRLMFGSDWPVCLLAGDYDRVWQETRRALDGRSAREIEAVFGDTAARVYRLT